MAVLSYIAVVLAMLVGAWFAGIVLWLVAVRPAGASRRATLVGARAGSLAMFLPAIWFAVFFGAPLGGGIAIGVAGERATQIGALLGYAASEFFAMLLGGLVGVGVATALHWARRGRNAT